MEPQVLKFPNVIIEIFESGIVRFKYENGGVTCVFPDQAMSLKRPELDLVLNVDEEGNIQIIHREDFNY